MRRGLLALVVAGLAACNATTETVVVVSAGDVAIPGQVDKVRIVVENTLASSPDLPLCTGTAAADCLTMPLVATLIPGPNHPSDLVTVDVTAYLHEQPVIRDAASFVFHTGQRNRLDFVLHGKCLGNVACADSTQTCGADGQCATITVTPLGANPAFDGGSGVASDLAGTDLAGTDLAGTDLAGTDLAAVDLRTPDMSFADLSFVDLAEPDLSPLMVFPNNSCVAAASIPAFGGYNAGTCGAYCASLALLCTDTCTTNRGIAGFGVEAWMDSADCTAYVSSAGQAACGNDLTSFSDPSVAKYRCCCH